MTVTTRSERLQAKVGAITINELLLERAISWRQDSLWRLGGRGDEPGQLALAADAASVARVCQLWEVPSPATVYARRARASIRPPQPAASAVQRRSTAPPSPSRSRRARPARRSHRRGLPQGLGAAASGRRAHLEGPVLRLMRAAGLLAPTRVGRQPWASEPRRRDHHRPRQTSCGEPTRTACLGTREGNARSSSPSMTDQECASASTRLAPARERGARAARRAGLRAHHGGTGRASRRASARRPRQPYLSDHFQVRAAAALGIRSKPVVRGRTRGHRLRRALHPTLRAAAVGGDVRDRRALRPPCSPSRSATTRRGSPSARPPHPGRSSARRSRPAPERLHDYRPSSRSACSPQPGAVQRALAARLRSASLHARREPRCRRARLPGDVTRRPRVGSVLRTAALRAAPCEAAGNASAASWTSTRPTKVAGRVLPRRARRRRPAHRFDAERAPRQARRRSLLPRPRRRCGRAAPCHN